MNEKCINVGSFGRTHLPEHVLNSFWTRSGNGSPRITCLSADSETDPHVVMMSCKWPGGQKQFSFAIQTWILGEVRDMLHVLLDSPPIADSLAMHSIPLRVKRLNARYQNILYKIRYFYDDRKLHLLVTNQALDCTKSEVTDHHLIANTALRLISILARLKINRKRNIMLPCDMQELSKRFSFLCSATFRQRKATFLGPRRIWFALRMAHNRRNCNRWNRSPCKPQMIRESDQRYRVRKRLGCWNQCCPRLLDRR